MGRVEHCELEDAMDPGNNALTRKSTALGTCGHFVIVL